LNRITIISKTGCVRWKRKKILEATRTRGATPTVTNVAWITIGSV
jgi:hypothetical protein